MRYISVFAILLAGCSVTYSPVEKIGDQEFKITAHGNGFSSIEELNIALREKAKQVCEERGFEFIRNFIGDDISYKNSTAYGAGPGYSDITNTSAIAKIRCLSPNAKD